MAKECANNSKTYLDIIEKLLQLDYNKYRNFDNTVEFILNRKWFPQQKRDAIHNMAFLYSGLNEVRPDMWTNGKSKEVAEAVGLMEDTDEYLGFISTLFNVKKQPSITEDAIRKSINDLGFSEIPTPTALTNKDGILTNIVSFFKVAKFKSQNDRDLLLEDFTTSILEQIKSLDIQQPIKDKLSSTTTFVLSKLFSQTNYISLQELGVLSQEELDKNNLVLDESGKYVFLDKLSNMGIKIMATNKSEQAEVLEALNNTSVPNLSIKIKIVPVNNDASEIIKKVNEKAETLKNESLLNRKHQTYENQAQVDLLKQHQDAEVLTVFKSSPEDNKFEFVGEINGKEFHIYGLENYAFVKADNTTEIVDFSDTATLQRVQNAALKKVSYDNFTKLSNSDLQTLSDLYTKFKSFKEKAIALDQEDVTDLFFDYFSVTKVKEPKVELPLSEAIKQDKTLGKMLTIVTLNSKGEVIGEEEKMIPFYFSANKTHGVDSYIQLSFLQKDQAIKHIDGDGKEHHLTEESYLKEILNIDSGQFFNMFFKEYAAKGLVTNNFILRFNDDGSYNYQRVTPIKSFSKVEFFAEFISALSDTFKVDDMAKAIREFDKNMFSFNLNNGLAIRFGLSSYFEKEGIPIKRNLQLEIVPRDSKYDEVYKGGEKGTTLLRFQFAGDNEKTLFSIMQSFSAKSKFVTTVQKMNGGVNPFAVLSLETPSDKRKFFSMAFELSEKSDAPQEVKELINDVQEKVKLFGSLINRIVINKRTVEGKVTTNIQEAAKRDTRFDGEKFLEIFEKDFTFKQGFMPEYLLLDIDKDGNYIPKLTFSQNSAKKEFNSTLNNLSVPIINYNASITSNEVPLVAEQESKLNENNYIEQPKQAEEIKKAEETIQDVTVVEYEDYDPFSLSGEVIQTISDVETKRQIEHVLSFLPQMSINISDLQDIIDLAKIDGNVMGIYKDRVIHLNKMLLSNGLVYHEAFHSVFRHLMDASQRTELIDKIVSQKKYSSLFTDAKLISFAKERNFVYNKEEMIKLQAEEILADGFKNFMLNNTKPQGIFNTIFNLLKRLIEFFTKHNDLINDTYSEIKNGYYRNKSLQSNIYDNQTAFEIIPGLIKRIKNDTNVVIVLNSGLDVSDQKDLIGMMSHLMMNDTTTKTPEEKFESARLSALDSLYNINNLTAQAKNEQHKSQILKEYLPLYNNLRFVLGAKLKGEKISDLNDTGLSQFDNLTSANNVKQLNGDPIFNDNGEYSLSLLKKLVLKRYNEIQSIGYEEVNYDIDKDVINDELSGDNVNRVDNDLDEDEAENASESSNDFESTYGQHDVISSFPAQLRQFFSSIRSDKHDDKLDIYVPRVLDGYSVYQNILRICSDLETEKIVEAINVAANTLIYDGKVQDGKDLHQVYNHIKTKCSINESGVPQSNLQLYHSFINTFNLVTLDLTMGTLKTPVVNEDNYDEQQRPISYSLNNKIASQNIKVKKDDILANMIYEFSKANTEEYKRARKNLLANIKLMKNNQSLLNSLNGSDIALEKWVNALYRDFTILGISVPKSLIKLSVIAIEKITKEQPLTLSASEQNFYDVNENFVKEGSYLEMDFFRSISDIYSLSHTETGAPVFGFTEMLDDNDKFKGAVSDQIKRVASILTKASKYIIKNDPTSLPSVIRNAEGKLIYEYAKQNPIITMFQDFRRNGLIDALQGDPYYENFIKAFISDNVLFHDIMTGKDTPLANQMKLFIKNMHVSLFGGIQQQMGDLFKDGKTFKTIDPKSLFIFNILGFLERETITDENYSITTFMRQFHQNESTNTNFLISAIYKPFSKKNGKAKTSNINNIVFDLIDVCKQEYSRIQREYNRVEEAKENYDNQAGKKLLINYNAVLNEDGTANVTSKKLLINYNAVLNEDGTANVTSKKLRAFKFNQLDDFFNSTDESKKQHTALVDAAKEGKSFDEFDDTVLKAALQVYAENEYKNYINELKKHDIIYTDENGVLQSKILPETIGKGNDSKHLKEIYGNTKGEYLENFLYDYFNNVWKNGLLINQLFDGDLAMNVKNFQDYVKRNKRWATNGDNMKSGTYKRAIVNSIQGFIHESYPEYGHYMSIDEIIRDDSVPADIKPILIESYHKALQEVKEAYVDEIGVTQTIDYGSMMREIFDGQSISSLMHQMDMHESLGRLNEEAKKIMIIKHSRPLSKEQIEYLASFKIVNNSKKTIAAARNINDKQSEVYIDRSDVSYINVPDKGLSTAYQKLDSLYAEIYSLRKQKEDFEKDEDFTHSTDINIAIRKNILEAHSYFKPMPHRKEMHNILNSMEYHQVDQLMDTSASKNASILPIDLNTTKRGPNNYHNFELSSMFFERKHKYLQVETSGIHDLTKISVQKKLLIAADLQILINKMSKEDLSASETKSLENLTKVLSDYHESLFDSSNARMSYLQTVMRQDGNFDLGKIFSIIRDSLTTQGASKATLDYFQLGEDGKPLFDANLTDIRNVLEYYFFSIYSKHVTDEKAQGSKSFLQSSYGYKVLVGEDNDVIPTEQIRKNPGVYDNYKSRNLGIISETDEDGVTTHYVECIIPKPLFQNKKEEEFWKEKLTRMFGVRIPTEDKRSMVALRVVDFMDASKMNTIITPYFVHMLAGSDFDIDSIYLQSFSSYKDLKGNYNLYGDYSNYENSDHGKFIEFVNFMSNDKELKPLISDKTKENKHNENNIITKGDEVYNFLIQSGFSEYTIDNVKNLKSLITQKETLIKRNKELFELKEELKKNFSEENREQIHIYNKEKSENYPIIDAVSREINDTQRIAKSIYKLKAIFDVFSKYNIPISSTLFSSNPIWGAMVADKFQNKNLEASLGILSNHITYTNLYANQRSSSAGFDALLAYFGLSLSSMTSKGGLFTPQNVVNSKGESQMNKDCVGITAAANKLMAFASQFTAVLNDKDVIWHFKNNIGESSMYYDTMGGMNSNGQRVIEIIGNTLGMFADAVKHPFPAALKLNEINTSTTIAMIGFGVNPNIAMAFNFMPEIRNAVTLVQDSTQAISLNTENRIVYYNNAIKSSLQNLITKDIDGFYELQKLGFISLDSIPEDITLINQNNLVISMKDSGVKIDLKSLDNNTLTLNDIGIKVTNESGDELSESQQKMILLHLYSRQADQSWDIRRATSLTNYFKRINPNIKQADALKESFEDMKDGNLLFSQNTSDKMLAEKTVFGMFKKINADLLEQFGLIFLDRSPMFKPIMNAFSSLFINQKTVASIAANFIGVQIFRELNTKEIENKNPIQQAVVDSHIKALKDAFSAEYWFTNNLSEELQHFKHKYPGNAFLKLLRSDKSLSSSAAVNNGEKNVYQTERFIKIIRKSSLRGNTLENAQDGVQKLMMGDMEDRLFVKKLFYHELARTGLMHKEGSFFHLFPTELKLPISKRITAFADALKESKNKEELIDNLKKVMGTQKTEDVISMLNTMFSTIIRGAIAEGTGKIRTITSISYNESDDATFRSKIAKNVDKSITDITQRKAIAKLALEKALNVKIKDKKFFSNSFGSEVTMNFNDQNITGVNLATRVAVASTVGVYYNAKAKMFNFPMIFATDKNTYYVLQGVDTDMVNKSLAETMIDNISTQRQGFNRLGFEAKYKKVIINQFSKNLSDIGFSEQEINKYNELTNKKLKNVIVKKEDNTALLRAEKNVISTLFKNPIEHDSSFNKDMYEKAAELDEGLNELYESLPTETIALENLIPTQDYFSYESYLENREPKLPVVVEKDGKYYVEDGHHRIVRDIIEGKSIEVKVFREEKSNTFAENNLNMRDFFNINKAKQKLSFRKFPLEFVDNISSSKGYEVAARNTGVKILLNENILRKKYEEKSWSKNIPLLEDGSKINALAENQFKTFDEFFTFVILHEYYHNSIKINNGETRGSYENRINDAALKDLNENYNKLPDLGLNTNLTQEEIDNLPGCK